MDTKTACTSLLEKAPLSALSSRELLAVQKPAQYLGGELNSIQKDPSQIDVRFALCFPDTYEVGMSHVGIQILYDILNRDERCWAERCYMPMADMEALLREKGIPLCSLESKTPLSKFDFIGFSLQYELCGTNILAMLELAGLPFYAAERSDNHPIVIGGGPYTYHPEALSPFFDAFFLGDAEEAVGELLEAVKEVKRHGPYSRKKVLDAIRNIEGIYLPEDFEPRYGAEGALSEIVPRNPARPVILRRLLPSLDGAPYPRKPVVPNIQTVHNRLSLEVMRGCVRGCRFCQAGYLYRPQRERSPQEIMRIVEESLPQTGYEELSLLSLSTADYCSIVPLLKSLMDRYAGDDRIAISFPSTRVDALTPEVLEQVQRVRRTGFTIAPEGGTQRLRDVINKGVSDDQIVETCLNVFRMGWTGIKLYFILGLPTETDEDLEGIIELAKRLRALPEARNKEITVSVSTLVPKPHTPFQWAAQIPPAETIRRQRYLADGLRKARVDFRYHDAFSTFLEGVFCRAGRELAPLLVRAYELGCRLDAWQDHLKEDLWMRAFLECNIDPNFYLRERHLDEVLPWDHLSCGIPKAYFEKEWERAVKAKPTPDCLTKSCSICSACDYDRKRNVLWPRTETEALFAAEGRKRRPLSEHSNQFRYRLMYAKSGAHQYLGHLELVSIFHRAARRAELPLAFSKGFHPMPRLSFGPPLQLGVASSVELVDAYLFENLDTRLIQNALSANLPEGLAIISVERVPTKATSLHEAIRVHRFRTIWLSTPRGFLGEWRPKLENEPQLVSEFKALLGEITIHRAQGPKPKRSAKRNRSKTEQSFRLADFVSNVTFDAEKTILEFDLLVDHTRACPKATEVLQAISETQIGDYSIEKIGVEFNNAVQLASSFGLQEMGA